MHSHALRSAFVSAAAVLLVAGCSTFVEGRALSMLNDPFLVGGLPATNGPSGIRSNAPAPTGKVLNTDNGSIDSLSLLSINDIEDYWRSVYGQSLKGKFVPISKIVSYNSTDPSSPIVCHNDTYQLVNAFYTSRCNLIETPWVSRRLGLLDSDQGLVGPVCIVERSFELGRWDVAEVAV
ncbi:hypothetical protein MAHJHV61_48090 [Mycobacterium avium subsp. hominissuis]